MLSVTVVLLTLTSAWRVVANSVTTLNFTFLTYIVTTADDWIIIRYRGLTLPEKDFICKNRRKI